MFSKFIHTDKAVVFFEMEHLFFEFSNFMRGQKRISVIALVKTVIEEDNDRMVFLHFLKGKNEQMQ